jgi:hypothetical protein
MGDLSRRRFLAASMAAAWAPGLWTPARAAAARQGAGRVRQAEGTTLAVTIERAPGSGYRALREGPPWPIVVREDLASLAPDRDDRRRAVASVVQLTDLHLVDAQSPGRVEFLDPLGPPFTGAYRPQEVLTTQVHAAMAERINALAAGPVTGRAFDCIVSTGDNIDNCQRNELAWFITGMDGGTLTPGSGAPGEYEGVQAWGDPAFWHPDDERQPDGFPVRPGLLEAGVAPFETPGFHGRWTPRRSPPPSTTAPTGPARSPPTTVAEPPRPGTGSRPTSTRATATASTTDTSTARSSAIASRSRTA